jgi:chorismate-pyruvate lyase
MSAANQPLSLLQRILLSTDGTVTDLIALYTGEQIRVEKLEQSIRTELPPQILASESPVKLLSRRILLAGASKNYLFADSLFLIDRLSSSIQHQLLTTDRPIGLMWKHERLETYREIVEQRVEPSPSIARHFDLLDSEPFVSRTYVIYHGGKPLGVITEKWPLSYFRD